MDYIANLPPTHVLQKKDAAHHLHPFTDTQSLNAKGTRIITRAEGVYLWDSEGNKILDGMAGLWCVNVGYGRKEIIEAVHRQMQQLPYYNTFFQTSHPPAIALAEKIAKLAPGDLDYVFFAGSGSEANDTVVRMVRHYWASKGKPTKKTIISRHNAYHGSTMAGASLGGMSAMHAQGGLPIPDITHINQPYWYAEGGDMDPAEFGLARARELEQEIERLGADNVAAFIGEPIQGAGGVIIPPETYWPEIQRICREHDILLVADEVICGFGRTGHWFGSQTFGFKPDLMPIAKGLSSGYLPIGAVVMSEDVAQGFITHGGEFCHGFTYSAHPSACAAALANLEILESERLPAKVATDTGPYLAERWQTLAEHPLVGETRICGLIGALELSPDKKRRAPFEAERGTVGTICRDHCFATGLVMRHVGDTMVISPPLVISHSEVDELIEKVHRALDLTSADIALQGIK
ncbi:Omega-amino acid--pyruvate aminotransferase [Pseudovibrio axinellae]|uniref:Omega-amino acid--pyruvate aminotransferase n=1 Tax=Pseudovibrio axinellae TaxID=989403 RepID=A0A165SWP2_9HYPH|nr:aspartate aminotransferase family protein [Pseudovibrio axinellae]KZL04579.1 Omega-amino acid--pyruvate aminotransferase [Pseudovibrio axinellae]SEQ72425.1 putrescine aminotransferase [Pseudovibrio axinellae]